MYADNYYLHVNRIRNLQLANFLLKMKKENTQNNESCFGGEW